MRIKMRTLDVGPKHIRRPGEVHEVDAKEGKALIDGGFAEPSKAPLASDVQDQPETQQQAAE
jgi:hypothetical protein